MSMDKLKSWLVRATQTATSAHSLSPSKAIKQTKPWRNGIVELHQDDERDAHVRVNDAEQHAEHIECLPDDDAAFVCRTRFDGCLIFHKPRALRIPPTAEEHGAKQKNIEPIHHQGKAIGQATSSRQRRSRRSRLQVAPDFGPRYGCNRFSFVPLLLIEALSPAAASAASRAASLGCASTERHVCHGLPKLVR